MVHVEASPQPLVLVGITCDLVSTAGDAHAAAATTVLAPKMGVPLVKTSAKRQQSVGSLCPRDREIQRPRRLGLRQAGRSDATTSSVAVAAL